ncbi:MAG: GatB/YqeY domain-containing protein [Zoogloeaceae bacterium]|jgi:uncharacterized protein YqeY|nr:GatB/YqeY domain-containing protein [Zoogloeaceae bacterium]
MSLKIRLRDDMNAALKAGEKERLGTIRLALAAIRQKEVDDLLTELSDDQIVAVLQKMMKQRAESLGQFEAAGRTDLAARERAEMAVLSTYLPEMMNAEAITSVINDAIAELGVTGIAEMGKLMALLKSRLAGKADMSEVSKLVRIRLG